MRSILAIFVALFGWGILLAYLYSHYYYHEITGNIFLHFFESDSLPKIILHIAIVSAPISSTITGFLINERRKLLIKTQISEKKYRNLVDTSLVGIYKSNLKGDILYVNEALIKMFEFESSEEMMSVDIISLHKNIKDREVLIEKLKGTGKINNFEIEALTKAGKTKNVLLSAVLDENVISGMIMDITELRQAEKALQRSEQMEIIGELAIGLANDIRNPLAGIKLSVEVLAKKQNFSEAGRAIISEAIDQIKRIDLLISDFLNFAKPPMPRLISMNMNKVLNNTIDSSLKFLSLRSKDSKAVKILQDFDNTIPEITVDPMQMQQAFLNLFLNASDAMPDSGTLVVKTSYCAELDAIQIEFSDTGKGIDEKVIDKIFHPYFTTKPKGTGLGLAITKRLIEQHGGEICVVNNPDRGARFIIFLPVEQKGKRQSA